MNRFNKLFDQQGRRGAFVPFFMLGDPTVEQSINVIEAALDEGADALELGIPFSDPIADGPVIQASAIRAARAGANVDRCFDAIVQLRLRTEVPIGLLVYYNLIYRRGLDVFCRDAAAAGVDALLAADLPYDKANDLSTAIAKHDLGSVFLVSQNTPDKRAADILKCSTAYTYAVGVMGTTGARESISESTRDFVRRLRRLGDEPFVVGFGVGSPRHAVEILQLGADGVIVGSALTRIIEQHLDHSDRAIDDAIDKIRAFIRQVKSLREDKPCSS